MNFGQHVRSDRSKWAVTAIAILLIGVILAAILTNGFKDGNPYCWFGHDYDENGICIKCGAEKPAEVQQETETPVENSLENGGMDITSIKSKDSLRLAVKRAAQTPAGENTYVLTATINPDTADNKTVSWSVSWKNDSSDFATGKTVTDYVTVTPGENLTATVTCLQAFGEQIEVTVTSNDNSDASASCTVDYVERITGINFTMPDLNSTSTSVDWTFVTTPHTIDAVLSLEVDGNMVLTEFYDYLDGVICSTVASGDITLDDKTRITEALITLNEKQLELEADIDSVIDLSWFQPHEEDQVSGLAGLFVVYERVPGSVIEVDHALINSAFRQAIEDFDEEHPGEAHATFDVSYTSKYNDETYSSDTYTVDVRFDVDSIYVDVGSIMLSEDNIIF